MRKSNFPNEKLNDLGEEFVAETVMSLRQLNEMGRPKTDKEIAERIDEYFEFCQRTGVRPGIESLCLALHISRTTLFNWNAGINCSRERQEIVSHAKSFIAAFLEQCMTKGKISPPSGIFLMKNWLNYRDTISFEDATASQQTTDIPRASREEIAARHAGAELPEPPDLD